MALNQKKISKAVKDAQKQAEAAVADMRSQFDDRLPDLTVDPTPFFAVARRIASRSPISVVRVSETCAPAIGLCVPASIT